MQAWHTRTALCLHEEEGLAKHVHLGGCLSGVCLLVMSINNQIPSISDYLGVNNWVIFLLYELS